MARIFLAAFKGVVVYTRKLVRLPSFSPSPPHVDQPKAPTVSNPSPIHQHTNKYFFIPTSYRISSISHEYTMTIYPTICAAAWHSDSGSPVSRFFFPASSLALACVAFIVFFVVRRSFPSAAVPKGVTYSTLAGKKPFNIYSLVVGGDLVSQTPPGESLQKRR